VIELGDQIGALNPLPRGAGGLEVLVSKLAAGQLGKAPVSQAHRVGLGDARIERERLLEKAHSSGLVAYA
jgi:hypothetical protein